jgi:recombination protein RecA
LPFPEGPNGTRRQIRALTFVWAFPYDGSKSLLFSVLGFFTAFFHTVPPPVWATEVIMAEGHGDRHQALELAISQIERQFGKGAVMRLGATGALDEVPVIPTGLLALDVALGVGGIPRGRVTEIFGPESSGKTTLALHVIAEAQRLGGSAAFIDAEHALDANYSKRIGVNTDELLISQPDTGEQALEITEVLVRSNALDVIVIDSVAALVPRAELDGDMGDSLPGLQARLMSQALRKLTAAISRSGTSAIFINQLREKIGVMFGSPEVTPGGRALKFYASVRLDIRRTDAIKSGQDSIGIRGRVKVVKNKLAPPFREAEFDMIYGEGISKEGSVLDLAVQHEIVEKSGTWFSYRDERIGQGRENAKKFLKENPNLLVDLDTQVRQAVGLKPITAAP